jgi:hypothetical protein
LWIGFGILLAIGFVAKAILPYMGIKMERKKERKNKGKEKTCGTEMAIEKAFFKIV